MHQTARHCIQAYAQENQPMTVRFVAACCVASSFLNAVLAQAPSRATLDVHCESVGATPDGVTVEQYTISNSHGVKLRVLTYGATITGVWVPDRAGRIDNVTLYLDNWDAYLQGHPLFGSVVGRYANRIAGASFEIDGQRFQLTQNLGQDHIHGGRAGLHTVVWQGRLFREHDRAGVELAHTSPDGHEGYPGTLALTVRYLLTTDNRLVMEYEATTDRPTHVNLTNHAYWNLAGAGSGDVLEHELTIPADRSVVADERRFPTGELREVTGTPLDFRTPHRIGERIDQLPDRNYDDCYVLNRAASESLTLAARVIDPSSGRGMEVHTTQPGVQLYTARGLTDRYGAGDRKYGPYHALCLETQHFPDAPNQPHFPSTLLRPGETYRHVTIHRFFTQ
jgi:aldose 1-epimerase